MTFYERYAAVASENGIDPCSAKAAEMIHTTKSAPSMWKRKNTTPKGDTVATIADAFHVSADYLLGRTDDPTDYCNSDIPRKPLQDAPKTVPFPQGTNNQMDPLYLLCGRLDASDRLKVHGVIQGLLMHEKYSASENVLNAAHARTDIDVTPKMVSHDEEIMQSEDF